MYNWLMPKARSQYVCQQCGYSQVGWAGKCPNCGSWGSLVETVTTLSDDTKGGSSKGRGSVKTPVAISSIRSSKLSRLSTKITELDRVLGGGIVPGQAVLLAGEPGIGKSTILLQLSNILKKTLYVSGEESVSQIKIRADRLGIKNKGIALLEETDVDAIIATAQAQVDLSALIVDSIQTISTGDLSGLAGSVGQVRESTFRLIQFAKRNNIPLFIVGHVTKEGTVAGPAVLAHLVDTVLWFEGDKTLTMRMIRAVKNRFGPTDEVGIFTMTDKGLESVENASKLFLSKKDLKVPGSVVTSTLEGTRPILTEIQSLVVSTKLAFPRRVVQGFDSRRAEMLIAILTRRAGIPLYDSDVFVNVVGGISIKEPAADLAVAMSIASSYFDKALPKDLLVVGEVGLLGEIRDVPNQDKRMKEAKRQGFEKMLSSKQISFIGQAVKTYLK